MFNTPGQKPSGSFPYCVLLIQIRADTGSISTRGKFHPVCPTWIRWEVKERKEETFLLVLNFTYRHQPSYSKPSLVMGGARTHSHILLELSCGVAGPAHGGGSPAGLQWWPMSFLLQWLHGPKAGTRTALHAGLPLQLLERCHSSSKYKIRTVVLV